MDAIAHCTQSDGATRRPGPGAARFSSLCSQRAIVGHVTRCSATHSNLRVQQRVAALDQIRALFCITPAAGSPHQSCVAAACCHCWPWRCWPSHSARCRRGAPARCSRTVAPGVHVPEGALRVAPVRFTAQRAHTLRPREQRDSAE